MYPKNDTKNKIRNVSGLCLCKYMEKSYKYRHINVSQRLIIHHSISSNASPYKRSPNRLFNIKPLINIKPFSKKNFILKAKYNKKVYKSDFDSQDTKLTNNYYILYIFYVLYFLFYLYYLKVK
jgi:hypothetical protein